MAAFQVIIEGFILLLSFAEPRGATRTVSNNGRYVRYISSPRFPQHKGFAFLNTKAFAREGTFRLDAERACVQWLRRETGI